MMVLLALSWQRLQRNGKDFKSDLKKKFFHVYDETMTREDIMNLCDERVSDPDWKWLINHWNSSKAEVRYFQFKI